MTRAGLRDVEGEHLVRRAGGAGSRTSAPAPALGNQATGALLQRLTEDAGSRGRHGLGSLPAAGNRAVASLFAQRQQVGPKAQTTLDGVAGDFQTFIDKGGPYTLSMYTLNDDIIGHAWIGVRRGDGRTKTVGFWPNSWYSGIVGPGQLMSEDGHVGGQTEALDEPIANIQQMYRVLSPIQRWDGALYSLLFSNCAQFVVDVWKTVTGKTVFPGNNADLDVSMWTPALIGMAIDERNQQKRLLDAARRGQSADADLGGGDTTVADAIDLGDVDAGTSVAGDAGGALADLDTDDVAEVASVEEEDEEASTVSSADVAEDDEQPDDELAA